jgi:hypothetical protein
VLAVCSNGELPDDILVDVGGGQLLVRDAAWSWIDMRNAAARDGVLLIIDNAYRPLARQREFWDARYVTYDTGSGEKHYFENRWWWRLPDAITAAVPGTSNHGYGLAVDLLRTDAQVAWLTEHAATYGWSGELEKEPWHWRRYAGDYVPTMTPTEEPDVQWRILAPTGSAAKFIAPMSALPNGQLAALYCAWLPTGPAAQEWVDRGVAELEVGVADLRNVPLFGTIPTGDPGHDWTAADFLTVS